MSVNKQELIGKIHQIEGLSNDEKSALIELLKTHKKYGLVWEDKPEEVEERLREELPVLTEVKDRAIISDAPDAPNHFKSKHFDFYANAQYLLIMKQQSINDSVIKEIFGVTGKDFNDIKAEIASLQKGELIIKDDTMSLLGISGLQEDKGYSFDIK